MWHARTNRDGTTVVCIACGTSVLRSEAREYDKEGDRWDRHGKDFEHLCKGCYRELCHQPRDELESTLVAIEREADTRREFLADYFATVEGRSESTEERER